MKLITETQIQKVQKAGLFTELQEKDIFNASKVFESWDEVFESEEFTEVWRGFQGKESDARISRKYEFVTAFVVEVDKKKNYGQPFKLFTVHKYNGVSMLREKTIGSMLSNSPMRRAFIFEDCFYLSDEYFAKSCKPTWEYLQKVEATVL